MFVYVVVFIYLIQYYYSDRYSWALWMHFRTNRLSKKGVADSYKQFEMLPFDASNLSRTLSISTNRTKQLKKRKIEK